MYRFTLITVASAIRSVRFMKLPSTLFCGFPVGNISFFVHVRNVILLFSAVVVITYHVRHSNGKCKVVTCICLCVCPAMHTCMYFSVTLGNDWGYPLVVHIKIIFRFLQWFWCYRVPTDPGKSWNFIVQNSRPGSTTTTTTVLRPFVRDYPVESVPEG